MRFVAIYSDPYPTNAVFEIDPETEFSEQVVAVNALGSLAASEKDHRNKTIAAYLGGRIRQAKPYLADDSEAEKASEDKPKEISIELSPQEAETLVNALVVYSDLTTQDLEYFGIMRNYPAVSSRIIEHRMADSMAKQLGNEFMLAPDAPAKEVIFGFGAVLSEV